MIVTRREPSRPGIVTTVPQAITLFCSGSPAKPVPARPGSIPTISPSDGPGTYPSGGISRLHTNAGNFAGETRDCTQTRLLRQLGAVIPVLRLVLERLLGCRSWRRPAGRRRLPPGIP